MSGTEGKRGEEFHGRLASAFKKASAGSIQNVHKEVWVFGSIDLNHQAILHDDKTGTNFAASDPRADGSAIPEPVRP